MNSLDVKATFNLVLTCSSSYPYVSFLSLSLVDIPDFNVRIEPMAESGLRGVDFGSFPVVSKWIKGSINSALSNYLSPHYISGECFSQCYRMQVLLLLHLFIFPFLCYPFRAPIKLMYHPG